MTIAEIIERLEKATGPDRELDRLIHFHVVAPWIARTCAYWVPAAFEGPNDFLWWTADRKADGKEGYHDGWLSYTASVDDALDLMSGKLSGWHVENLCQWEATVLRDRGEWMCDLVAPQKLGEGRVHTKCPHAPSPAIALTLAILKAIQAQEVTA